MAKDEKPDNPDTQNASPQVRAAGRSSKKESAKPAKAPKAPKAPRAPVNSIKVVVRKLPPLLSEDDFDAEMEKNESVHGTVIQQYYVAGYYPANQFDPVINSRCYLLLKDERAAARCAKYISSLTFTDSDQGDEEGEAEAKVKRQLQSVSGEEYKPVVERAMYYRMPTAKEGGQSEKVPKMSGTLASSKLYKSFVDYIGSPSKESLEQVLGFLSPSSKKKKQQQQQQVKTKADDDKKKAKKTGKNRKKKKTNKASVKTTEKKGKPGPTDPKAVPHGPGAKKPAPKKKKNKERHPTEGSSVSDASQAKPKANSEAPKKKHRARRPRKPKPAAPQT